MDETRSEPPGSRNEQQSEPLSSESPLWPPEPSDSAEPADFPEPAEPAAGSIVSSASSLDASRDPPWSLADLGTFLLFAFLSFLFVNLVAASVFSFLRQRFGWEITAEEVFTETSFVVLVQAVWELLWLVFIYLLITTKYRRRFWQALRWVRGPQRGMAYLVAGVGLSFLAQLLFNLFPSEKQLPIEKLFSSAESAYLLAVFGICVAPFVEEMVFRGFFYPVFERLWGMAAAVLLSALLFAAIHIPQLSGGWQEISAIFMVGGVFSYCRAKTGSLLPPFLMHLAYNACLFVSLYLSTDRFRELGG